MKLVNTFRSAFLILGALASTPVAQDGSPIQSDAFSLSPGRGYSSASGAPEMNPDLLAAGAVLLIGGTLILLARRRTRRTPAAEL